MTVSFFVSSFSNDISKLESPCDVFLKSRSMEPLKSSKNGTRSFLLKTLALPFAFPSPLMFWRKILSNLKQNLCVSESLTFISTFDFYRSKQLKSPISLVTCAVSSVSTSTPYFLLCTISVSFTLILQLSCIFRPVPHPTMLLPSTVMLE